jgi:hypothetical protein
MQVEGYMKTKQQLMPVTNLRCPTKSLAISMSKLVAASTFMLMIIGAAPAAQAHEFRSFGKGYSVFLGSYVEPAFAGFENGIDIFPAYSYTAFDGTHQSYLVDTGAGDTFNFTMSEILYSKDPLPIIHNAGDIPKGTLVIDTLVPHGRVNPTLIEEKFGSANLKFSQFGPEYNNHFLPKSLPAEEAGLLWLPHCRNDPGQGREHCAGGRWPGHPGRAWNK